MVPKTKSKLHELSQQLKEELLHGQVEPLEVLRYRKYMEKFLSLIKETLDQCAREEAEKYGQKVFMYKDIKIELSENGVTYDYSKCNDPVYKKLERQYKDMERQLKSRQAFLRTLDKKLVVVDEESGEACDVYPPVRSSTSGLKSEII